jgi:uncharacterized Zn-binding protein involved in type VI secretion
MPAVARVGDPASINHETCSVEAQAETGSPNVFINGIACHRVGDVNTSHTESAPNCNPHSTALVVGSGSVFINGISAARVSDTYACGSHLISGSPNVFAGG